MATKAKTKLKPRGKPFEQGHNIKSPGAPVKEMRLSTWLEKELDEVLGKQKEAELGHEYQAEVSRRQAIARKLVNMALHKSDQMISMAAIREIADRTEGRPAQALKLSGDSDNPISLVISKAATELPTNNPPQDED